MKIRTHLIRRFLKKHLELIVLFETPPAATEKLQLKLNHRFRFKTEVSDIKMKLIEYKPAYCGHVFFKEWLGKQKSVDFIIIQNTINVEDELF